MTITKQIRLQRKYLGEDIRLYWNATRFLWRVFTHPKNPRMRVSASHDVARGQSFRAFTGRASRVSEAVVRDARGDNVHDTRVTNLRPAR